jgi:hypothetical protein
MNTITERALIRRINRKLAHDGQRLRKTRPAGYGLPGGLPTYPTELGEFHIVDNWTSALVSGHENPEELGRELGVLRAYEKLESP